MRTQSLAGRLMTFQQAIAATVIVVFATSALALTAQVLRRQQDAMLVNTVSRMATSYDEERSEEGDEVKAAQNVLAEGVPGGTRVLIFGSGGRLLGADGALPVRHGVTPGVAAPTGHVIVREGHSALGARIQALTTRAPVVASLSALAVSLGIAAVPLLLVSLLVGGAVARRALRPLSDMADRASHASEASSVRLRLEPAGLVEIDRLAAAFDRLLVRLDDALRAERRLTADASHELRTPLTVLSGELEIAAARAPDEPSIARAAEQVRSMREVVEAILLLHRSAEQPMQARFEPVNLCDVVRETTADMLAGRPDRRADVRLDAPDELLVSGDPALLAAALRNLIENAFKFTRAGQPVHVRVRGDGRARVIVDDGGPGIPVADRPRIFDAFFRGAEMRGEHDGVGLGLPILKRVARAHGGDVDVSDSDLGGARFDLALPLLETSAAAGGASEPANVSEA